MYAEVKAFGFQLMKRRFDDHVDRTRNLRPAFLLVYERFREMEQVQFQTQGHGPAGRWPKLAKRTLKMKIKRNEDVRILHSARHLLRNSLTRRGSRYAIFRTRNNELVMGSRHPAGKFHQSTKPRTKMPYRPPVDLYPEEKRELIGIIQDYMMTGNLG